VGSPFFCFLPTKAHFSSNWTSRVQGGKGHPLVVGGLGVPADLPGQPPGSRSGGGRPWASVVLGRSVRLLRVRDGPLTHP
jgi:hypothetical protein